MAFFSKASSMEPEARVVILRLLLRGRWGRLLQVKLGRVTCRTEAARNRRA